MRIEDLAITVRPRPSWEAMDLGMLMVRKWAKQVYGPWLVLIVACYLLALFTARYSAGWTLFFFWLVKPLLGRIVLFVISREMFGSHVSLRQALRQLPQLLLKYASFWCITFFRISPVRAVIQPIALLEEVHGRLHDQRKSLIRGQLFGTALGVSLIFLCFELLLLIGLFSLFAMAIPEMRVEVAANFFNVNILVYIYPLVVAFLEPFFVAVNFALYLNCRTILEGWDLELAFRRIRDRLESERLRAAVTSTGAVLVLLFMLASLNLRAQSAERPQIDNQPPTTAEAQFEEEQDANLPLAEAEDFDEEDLPSEGSELLASPNGKSDIAESSSRDIKEILSQPPFGSRVAKRTIWVPRFSQKPASRPQSQTQVGLLGPILRFLLYGLAFAVLGAIVYFIIMFLAKDGPITTESVAEVTAPVASYAAIIDPDTLPADILLEARKCFAVGDTRLALSLLFRGALHVWTEEGKLIITEFATEGECLRAVKTTMGGPISIFFAHLVGSWQAVAYGHRSITAETFENLCRDWDKHLGVRR